MPAKGKEKGKTRVASRKAEFPMQAKAIEREAEGEVPKAKGVAEPGVAREEEAGSDPPVPEVDAWLHTADVGQNIEHRSVV